ncbi:MAG: hypothetical protein JRG79_05930 [Deltaproteobacteria bacterium]|nr:hypothetical protein [Deltaproteobacteria bacterium]
METFMDSVSALLASILLTGVALFLVLWVPFLRHAREIVVADTQIIFRRAWGQFETKLENLTAMKVVQGGNYIKIASKTGSILILPTVAGWSDLMKKILSVNDTIGLDKKFEKQLNSAHIKWRNNNYSLLLAIIPAVIICLFSDQEQMPTGGGVLLFVIYYIPSVLGIYALLWLGTLLKGFLSRSKE